jgi:anti-sigma regulatory factor (Ser/Thr protein kinase)
MSGRTADAGSGDGPSDLVVAHLPAAPAFIRLARLLVACFLETHLELAELRDHGVRLAVTEVFTAAVAAQDRASVASPLVLRLALRDGAARISLEDAGGPFAGEPGDTGTNPEVRAGLVLARALVDEAWVEPTGSGNVVHLIVSGNGRR